MDHHAVDIQVVSPVPVTLADWATPTLAARYLAEQNDRIAEAVAGSGGRLAGLGAVPVQDADLAVAELHRVTDELGLVGVEVGTLNGGAELDDPRLRPFLAEAAEAGVPIFVHPVDGAGATRCGDPFSAFAVGMLTDTALAAKALVFGGVLSNLPGLRVCLSHGGGSFPYVYPRLKTWATTNGIDGKLFDANTLDTLVRRLYVDTLVFDPALVKLLVERYGPDRVAFGSDDPFIPWGQSALAIADRRVAAPAIWSTNAASFYNLSLPTLAPEGLRSTSQT
jgi:aminocarboxymuconate-semialdehyde decarboxylase